MRVFEDARKGQGIAEDKDRPLEKGHAGVEDIV
jgi:hypothetical protein